MATHHQNKNDPDNPIDKEKILESKLSKFLSDIHEKGELTEDKLEDIMREEKPNQKEQFKTSYDNIRHYFPKNYSNEQINNKIMELLEKYQKEWKQKIRDSR